MKIVVVGAGGIGGLYGGLLARAGQDVTFIARGAHLQAMRKNGLQIKSVLGDFTIAPCQVTDQLDQVGITDLVIVATKTYHLNAVAHSIQPLVGANTNVLPLQNGVDAAEQIGTIIGMKHILGGVTWISSAIEAPGIIRQYSQFCRIVLGELDGSETPRLRDVHKTLNTSGAKIEISTDIRKVLWNKLTFIAPVSAVGSLTRVPIDEFREVPETRRILAAIVAEVAAVAAAQGVQLEADIVEKTLDFIDMAAPGVRASMQRDVESGRPSELEALVGVIVRLGQETNVNTPVTNMVYALLKPGEQKIQQEIMSMEQTQ